MAQTSTQSLQEGAEWSRGGIFPCCGQQWHCEGAGALPGQEPGASISQHLPQGVEGGEAAQGQVNPSAHSHLWK